MAEPRKAAFCAAHFCYRRSISKERDPMRILTLTLALLPAAAMAADRDPPVKPAKACRTEPQLAGEPKAKPLRPRTLAEMPPAQAYYPALRIVDGCETPMKVSDRKR
jgi:hypothetical protein